MKEMTPEAATALRRPFPPESIGHLPKGGAMLEYAGHAAVTDRLLTVDPEWTWEPLALDEVGLPALDRSGNLWIRLTICGVTRLGVGDGKNAKEAIGDAIRNAAMRFGVALDLWAKENLVEFAQAATVASGGAPAPPLQSDKPVEQPPPTVRTMSRAPAPASREQIVKIKAQLGDLGVTDRHQQLARVVGIVERELESSNDLTKAEASRVIERLDAELEVPA
jgi:hypothetical protein